MLRIVGLTVCVLLMALNSWAQQVLCDGQTFENFTEVPFTLRDPGQSNSIIRNCIFRNSPNDKAAINIYGATNVTIEGCTFDNIRAPNVGNDTQAIGIPANGNNITIRNNTFVDIGGDGIQMGGAGNYTNVSNITIEDNTFYVRPDGYEPGKGSENGVDIKQTTSGIVVRNNTFYGFRSCFDTIHTCSGGQGVAIVIHGKSPGGPARDVLVEGNTFYDNERAILLGKATRPLHDIRVFNNLIYDQLDYGIFISSTDPGGNPKEINIAYNTFVNNDRHIEDRQPNNQNCHINYNFYSDDSTMRTDGCQYADDYQQHTHPAASMGFVDLPGRDLRLTGVSPALDQVNGALVPAVTTDFLGTARPQSAAFDVGAYEFAGLSGPTLVIVPGAEGFGALTWGGSGRQLPTPASTIYIVTNLNDSGPGSLREAVEAAGSRTVLFETSGDIPLATDLVITNDYITIAGQTAPSPGITLRGPGYLRIRADHVAIQHIRARSGDGPGDCDARDSFAIGDANYVFLDHVTATWAPDENVSLWGQDAGDVTTNVTVSNSLIAEGLYDSCHTSGPHSHGLLIGRNVENVTVYRNILAHNDMRNPLLNENVNTVEVINNLIYDPGPGSTGKIDIGSEPVPAASMNVLVIGNAMLAGPTTNTNFNLLKINTNSSAGNVIYMEDNRSPDYVSSQLDIVNFGVGAPTGTVVTSNPPFAANPTPISVGDIGVIVAGAGARPRDRDVTDTRIIEQVLSGTGGLIDCLSGCANPVPGGYTPLAVNTHTLNIPADPNGIDVSGYTNLELWLHQLADAVTVQTQFFGLAKDATVLNGTLR